MKQRDKHIKDILFSRMFLFADDAFDTSAAKAGHAERTQDTSTTESNAPSGETDSAATKTSETKETEATKTEETNNTVPVNSKGVVRTGFNFEPGSGSGALNSQSDPKANIPGLSFTPVYKNYVPTSDGVEVTTDALPVFDPKKQPSAESLLSSNAGSVSGEPKFEAANIQGRTTASDPVASQPAAQQPAPQPAPQQPAQFKSSYLTEEGNVDNEKLEKDGERYEAAYKKEVTDAHEAWLKGEEGKKATNQQKLDHINQLRSRFNARPENADYLAMKEGRNTTGNIALDMLPRKGETWAQAYKRWTPEQKAAAWGGLGIGGLFSIGLMSKKKKDMLDYALMVGSPLAGIAAGAGGAAMYHSDPNTVNQGRYQHYYKQYTTPTKGA